MSNPISVIFTEMRSICGRCYSIASQAADSVKQQAVDFIKQTADKVYAFAMDHIEQIRSLLVVLGAIGCYHYADPKTYFTWGAVLGGVLAWHDGFPEEQETAYEHLTKRPWTNEEIIASGIILAIPPFREFCAGVITTQYALTKTVSLLRGGTNKKQLT